MAHRNRGTGKDVLKLMTSQPGVPVHFSTVAEAMGKDAGTICSSLAQLVKSPGNGITRVGSGVYVFNPTSPSPNGSTVTQPELAAAEPKQPGRSPARIGTRPKGSTGPRSHLIRIMPDGRVIVEVDGELYVASKLDV